MSVVRRPGRVGRGCPILGSTVFLESALGQPSRETILKTASTCRALELHFKAISKEAQDRRNRYDRFMAQLESKPVSESEKRSLMEEFLNEESQISRCSRSRMSESRFERLRQIGRGGFGSVFLVKDKITHEYFALKVLKKSSVIMNDQLSNVQTERDILSKADSDWVVQLHASFQDSENLYLALEYVPGGDLMSAMISAKVFPEATARFFAGEIALALNSIHQLNIVHRDLKFENILIREDGHIKLADFGLSVWKASDSLCEIMSEIQNLMSEHYHIYRNSEHVRAHGFGTCCYAAPEVLRGGEATPASDFWALGVIIFEMLCGYAPFRGMSPRETAIRVINYRSLRYPHGLSQNALDLLQHLLCEQEDRYGFDDIVRHPFFEGFDFQNPGMNLPPMKPVLSDPLDTTYFHKFEEEAEEMEPVPDDDLTLAAFVGFTYNHPRRNRTLAKLGIYI